ncbi:MAG TPA: dephospho-CoA kinase [Vicinamibacterales bacterium]|nr:dephospho-CoA kinase [Vicinamibacterales bacterium]
MIRVALTGGIGTGKSYCLAKFAELGAPTVNADSLARQAVAPGTGGFEQVVSRFGTTILRADGSLDRKALASLVFTDVDARRALEAIVHPVVYRAIERWFEGLARSGHGAGIADIPLLFETGREHDFDAVVVTTCPPAVQKARVMKRDSVPLADAESRIASQMPLEEKVTRADHVIDTSGTFEETDRQVREIWTSLSRGGSPQR